MLAEVEGVTVLLHDQACAAENRRARSRGLLAKPGFRIVINERVCEGCGDCGDKSNCLSVQPVDTPYGRKTRIHQTSCNFDMTCLQGDCPAFATVTVDCDSAATSGDRMPAATLGDPIDGVPDPTPIVPVDEFTVRLSGIGGTGVVTVSQILGTAAMLDGKIGARPRPDRPVAEGRSGRQRPADQLGRRAGVEPRQHARASTACSPSTCSSPRATPTASARARRSHGRDRVGRRHADRRDGRPPDDPVPRAGHADRPARRGVTRRPTTATSTRPRSPPGCSATRRPPTSCCSASPCSTARSPSSRSRSSGRSSSTASPSSATSPPSGGAGAGPTGPTRSSSAAGIAEPTGSGDHRRARSSASPPISSTTSPSATPSGSATVVERARAAEAGCRPGELGVHRRRRPPPAQADGLQGRVRGRPAAARCPRRRRRTRRSAARAPR